MKKSVFLKSQRENDKQNVFNEISIIDFFRKIIFAS